MTPNRIPLAYVAERLRAMDGDAEIPTYRTIAQAARDGTIPAIRRGCRWDVLESDLAAIRAALPPRRGVGRPATRRTIG